MSEPRHYRSKESFRRAEAYRHIHHVPHGAHPPKTIYIGGRKTRVTPDSMGDPPSWLPWVLLIVVVAIVLLFVLGLASTALLRLTSLSLPATVVSASEPCAHNCTTNVTNSSSGGFLSGVSLQDVGGVILLVLTVSGLGGALYMWQGGSGGQGDIGTYADTGSNVASTGASVYGGRRAKGSKSKSGRSRRR